MTDFNDDLAERITQDLEDQLDDELCRQFGKRRLSELEAEADQVQANFGLDRSLFLFYVLVVQESGQIKRLVNTKDGLKFSIRVLLCDLDLVLQS